jgi:hypothetical protein
MRQYLTRHPDASLEGSLIDVLADALDDAWRAPDVANFLFEDKLSLRHTLAKRMIEQAKLGTISRTAICADGIAYLTRNYASRWRN